MENSVIIFGSQGQLGQQLTRDLSGSFDIHPFSKVECSITDYENVACKIKEICPKVVINAAAFTDVDSSETNVSKANSINHDAVRNLAILSDKHGFTLIHFSTDYIFNKLTHEPIKESEEVDPINVYGLSKYRGEQAIVKYCKKFYIFRISWVYSEFGSNFPKTILKLAREKKEIKIVNDQYGSPTPTTLISTVIQKVLINNLKNIVNYGIYNLSPEEVCSWYDIGLEILKSSSKQEKYVLKKIIPVSSEEFSSVAKRPSYSYLDNTKLKETFGIKIKNWNYYLNAYLKKV